ncbi:MAG TPA: hypothetical protein VGV34_00105, partial [Solirubrobacterales bacterium]|nr:hypothetical protein [Solirubrobacterales bacterium]
SFTGWSGCTSVDGTECKVTVDAAENVTAGFAPITHQLSVAKAGTGSGTVTSAPAGIDCGSSCAAAFEEGESITLTATPAQGSEFTGWSGGLCTGTGTCTVTLGAATAVVADFATKPAEGGGSVTPPATPATPPPATPTPPAAKPKPLKCKKGFKKKKVRGKVRCVKTKKKPQKKRG